jgi:hypothetical protein
MSPTAIFHPSKHLHLPGMTSRDMSIVDCRAIGERSPRDIARMQRPAIRLAFKRSRDIDPGRRSEFHVASSAPEHRWLVLAPLLHIHRRGEGVKRTFAYVANNFVVAEE